VLVERQQDERAKAVDEETAGGHPAVEPSLEVGSRLLTIQSGESPRAAGEQRGPPFQESQGDRQAERIDFGARSRSTLRGPTARRTRSLGSQAVKTTLPTFLRSWIPLTCKIMRLAVVLQKV
jgi:hypothetical protein